MKIEKGRKSPVKMVQNQKFDVENEGKKGENLMLNKKSDEDTNTKKKKDQYDFVEKTILNEEASKPGATIDNMDDNAGIGVSSRSKRVHISTSEPAKKDVQTSLQQNDIVQSPSQEKRQKMALGGNSRPPATQPPTKASAQWKDPPNVGKNDELQRLIIIPNGLGFYPSIQSAKAMVESMCSVYNEPWRYWKDVPLNIRERMFDEFKMKCAWSHDHEAKIREFFFRKCSRRLSDLLWYARKHDKRPSWIREDIWKRLNKYWASPEFKKKKHTVEKEAQTSVLPCSPQPSDKEE
ncbi:hypothetical protein KY289_030160 [Solanum tuberosum]|nr:hypothetical protein KY289_030160 [Solanum tuberosum]